MPSGSEITGRTRVVGLFGYPVEHSLSPAMHNAAFRYLNLDYCYVTFSVEPGRIGEAVAAVRALNLRGVNVTVPHKERVIPFLDEVNEEASFIGAVNTVVHSGGILTGYNTDGRGFMESLVEAGISAEGKNILVVGAGGACRAISYYLVREASSLMIFDVDKIRADNLVSDLRKVGPNVSQIEDLSDLGEMNIIINATPIGLKESDPLPLDISGISPDMIVCDLIYRDTRFIKAASEKGCRTLGGLGMLLHQGILAFELWTGVRPPVEVMRLAIEHS